MSSVNKTFRPTGKCIVNKIFNNNYDMRISYVFSFELLKINKHQPVRCTILLY